MKPGAVGHCVLIGALLVACPSLSAASIDQLIEQGKLQVSLTALPQENIVLYQPVTLQIEVATDRWFSRGTRVEKVDIKNAITYRTSSLATNFTRTEAGRTWSVQQWNLLIYPQRAGSLNIPRIAVFVSANTEGDAAAEGNVLLPEIPLEVSVPEAMAGTDVWLATENLAIEESYQGVKDTYRAGDAVIRTISMQIRGVPAMMLPELAPTILDGLGVYTVQPRVHEESNRGTLVGRREQQFIYTIEQPGSYTLPERRFYWWNLTTQQQEIIALPAYAFATGGYEEKPQQAASPARSRDPAVPLIDIAAALLAILVLLMLLFIFTRSHFSTEFRRRRQRRYRERAFLDAVKRGLGQRALQLLYELLIEKPQFSNAATLESVFGSDTGTRALLYRLKRQSYAVSHEQNLSAEEARQLLDYLNKKIRKPWPWQIPVKLTLNP